MPNLNKAISLFLLIIPTEIAVAFPENVRLGYANCSSCHVSPTGGGVLNSYGRMSGAEVLSTFSTPREENYSLEPPPKWFAYGGDIRYLNVSSQTLDQKYSRRFMMQSDLELAVSPIPGLTVSSAIGYYNVDLPFKVRPLEEQRRNFLLLDLNPHLSFRVGRFFPAYGIMSSDHTLVTRSALGFTQGSETLNLEGSFKGEHGEVFVTAVGGDTGKIELKKSEGYKWDSNGPESGVVGRASIYPGRRVQIGVSGFRLTSPQAVRTAAGAFTMIGFTEDIYALLEFNRLHAYEVSTNVWQAKLGVEVYKGIHLTALHEGQEKAQTVWRFGAGFFPRPHWEFVGEFRKRMPAEGYPSDEWVFILHYYI